MKKSIAILLISMIFSTLAVAKVVIIYNPDTGTATPIVVIGDD